MIFGLRCGIYCLKNEETGECYVGASTDLDQRMKTHEGKLRRKSHTNQKLLQSYINSGCKPFSIFVLEECKHTDLRAKEEYWTKKLSPTLGTRKKAWYPSMTWWAEPVMYIAGKKPFGSITNASVWMRGHVDHDKFVKFVEAQTYRQVEASCHAYARKLVLPKGWVSVEESPQGDKESFLLTAGSLVEIKKFEPQSPKQQSEQSAA